MSITFRIPGPLLPFTGGRTVVQADAAAGTVGEALAQLWRLYPGLRDRVLTGRPGAAPRQRVRRHGASATPAAVHPWVRGGDRISAVSGERFRVGAGASRSAGAVS